MILILFLKNLLIFIYVYICFYFVSIDGGYLGILCCGKFEREDQHQIEIFVEFEVNLVIFQFGGEYANGGLSMKFKLFDCNVSL